MQEVSKLWKVGLTDDDRQYYNKVRDLSLWLCWVNPMQVFFLFFHHPVLVCVPHVAYGTHTTVCQ